MSAPARQTVQAAALAATEAQETLDAAVKAEALARDAAARAQSKFTGLQAADRASGADLAASFKAAVNGAARPAIAKSPTHALDRATAAAELEQAQAALDLLTGETERAKAAAGLAKEALDRATAKVLAEYAASITAQAREALDMLVQARRDIAALTAAGWTLLDGRAAAMTLPGEVQQFLAADLGALVSKAAAAELPSAHDGRVAEWKCFRGALVDDPDARSPRDARTAPAGRAAA